MLVQRKGVLEFCFTICATQAQLQAIQNNTVPDGKIGAQSCQHFTGKGTLYPSCMAVKSFQNQRKGGSAFVFPFLEILIVKFSPVFVAADAVKAIKHSLERHIFTGWRASATGVFPGSCGGDTGYRPITVMNAGKSWWQRKCPMSARNADVRI